MDHGTMFAGAAREPTPTLYDAIRAFASEAGAETLEIEALVGRRGSAAVEGAAELGVEELLCERGYGGRLAATLVEFRVAGSPTRARYLDVMRRPLRRFVGRSRCYPVLLGAHRGSSIGGRPTGWSPRGTGPDDPAVGPTG